VQRQPVTDIASITDTCGFNNSIEWIQQTYFKIAVCSDMGIKNNTNEKIISVVVKAQPTEYDRADSLMDLLLRRSDTYLPQFYESLMATDQKHVVHLMNFKGSQTLALS